MKIEKVANLAPIETLIDPRKCKIHRQWMKKGVCDNCKLEKDKVLSKYKQKMGIVDVPIKIIKL